MAAELYGFYPSQVRIAKGMIRELARVLLTGRPDANVLRPALITDLTATLNDFVKYHQYDASAGFIAPEVRPQNSQAWDAQPQKETA